MENERVRIFRDDLIREKYPAAVILDMRCDSYGNHQRFLVYHRGMLFYMLVHIEPGVRQFNKPQLIRQELNRCEKVRCRIINY